MPASRQAYVIASLAVSLDGRIASAFREKGALGSRSDRDRLDAFRAEADALVVGAGTIRDEDPPLAVRHPLRRRARREAGKPETPLVVVVSRGGGVPAGARFLRDDGFERWLAVPESLEERVLEPLAPALAAGRLQLQRAGSESVEPPLLIEALEARGLRRVLVEGGGTLLAAFLDAGCIDELRLTICPTLLGGTAAPSLYPGPARRLAERHRLRLLGMGCHGDEVYLRLAPLGVTPSPA